MSTQNDKEIIKDLLAANMFDGDREGGIVSMKISTLLEDVSDIITADYFLVKKPDYLRLE